MESDYAHEQVSVIYTSEELGFLLQQLMLLLFRLPKDDRDLAISIMQKTNGSLAGYFQREDEMRFLT